MPSLDFQAEQTAFREWYIQHAQWLRNAATSLRTLISLLLSDRDAFPTPKVLSRVKDREESIRKFGRKYQAALEEEKRPYEIKDYITDLVGLRVICLYEPDIKEIRSVLMDNFELVDSTDRLSRLDTNEDIFGYKSLHLDMTLKRPRADLPEYSPFGALQFEVQIRTVVQDAWATLDHKIEYKKSIPRGLKRRISVLAALFELADQEFLNIRNDTATLAKLAAEQDTAEDRLDAFRFVRLARERFASYQFVAHKVDGFVEELSRIDPCVTERTIDSALGAHWDTLSRYQHYLRQSSGSRMNPYTVIRHALFLSNPEAYASLLFDFARHNLEKWLRTQESPSEAQVALLNRVREVSDLPGYVSLEDISVQCPECNGTVPLKVAAGEEEPKLRFCLTCKRRLEIDPVRKEVIRHSEVEPIDAEIVGFDKGRYMLRCSQCNSSAKAFYADGQYAFGVCYYCERPTLLRADTRSARNANISQSQQNAQQCLPADAEDGAAEG